MSIWVDGDGYYTKIFKCCFIFLIIFACVVAYTVRVKQERQSACIKQEKTYKNRKILGVIYCERVDGVSVKLGGYE